jgi:uncharacterized protein YcfJ
MSTMHNATPNTSRIHPLFAVAAGSVILVSLAGTAAITGLLPNSKANTAAPSALPPVTAQSTAAPLAIAGPVPAPAPVALAAAPIAQQYALVPVQSAPVPMPVQAAPAPAPVIKKVVHRTHPVQRPATQVARYDDRADRPYRDDQRSYSEPVRAPQAQPVSYLGVGAGALIGGLVGNQVGGGNGKKLATIAGVIGGGMLGNEIANRSQNGR